MDSLDQRRKQVAIEIQVLSRQVEEMDSKIRAYLADRLNKPHPRHLDLIERIQGYRIDPAITGKNLMTLLDNLQWKIYYSKKAWKQLWENAESQRQNDKTSPVPYAESAGRAEDEGEGSVPAKAQYSVDTLWEIQQEKLRVYGLSEKETKPEFKKRMIQEYKKLSKDKKSGQEIIMTFDKDTKHCKLDVK